MKTDDSISISYAFMPLFFVASYVVLDALHTIFVTSKYDMLKVKLDNDWKKLTLNEIVGKIVHCPKPQKAKKLDHHVIQFDDLQLVTEDQSSNQTPLTKTPLLGNIGARFKKKLYHVSETESEHSDTEIIPIKSSPLHDNKTTVDPIHDRVHKPWPSLFEKQTLSPSQERELGISIGGDNTHISPLFEGNPESPILQLSLEPQADIQSHIKKIGALDCEDNCLKSKDMYAREFLEKWYWMDHHESIKVKGLQVLCDILGIPNPRCIFTTDEHVFLPNLEFKNINNENAQCLAKRESMWREKGHVLLFLLPFIIILAITYGFAKLFGPDNPTAKNPLYMSLAIAIGSVFVLAFYKVLSKLAYRFYYWTKSKLITMTILSLFNSVKVYYEIKQGVKRSKKLDITKTQYDYLRGSLIDVMSRTYERIEEVLGKQIAEMFKMKITSLIDKKQSLSLAENGNYILPYTYFTDLFKVHVNDSEVYEKYNYINKTIKDFHWGKEVIIKHRPNTALSSNLVNTEKTTTKPFKFEDFLLNPKEYDWHKSPVNALIQFSVMERLGTVFIASMLVIILTCVSSTVIALKITHIPKGKVQKAFAFETSRLLMVVLIAYIIMLVYAALMYCVVMALGYYWVNGVAKLVGEDNKLANFIVRQVVCFDLKDISTTIKSLGCFKKYFWPFIKYVAMITGAANAIAIGVIVVYVMFITRDQSIPVEEKKTYTLSKFMSIYQTVTAISLVVIVLLFVVYKFREIFTQVKPTL